MSEKTIRVLLVDDHDIVRQGLSVFLKAFSDLELIGEANDGKKGVELCAQLRPDVVLMDLAMPEMDGVEATRRIHAAQPEVQIMVLTSFKEDDMVRKALQAGAVGYYMKNISAGELAQAIRSVAAGKLTLAPEAARALLDSVSAPPLPSYNLTDRELEVLALMIKGMSNPEIAERLVVSRSTIKFHVSSILAKLGASSRSEAVALAVERHLVN